MCTLLAIGNLCEKKGKTQMEFSKPPKIVHKFNSHHELKKKYWYSHNQKSLDTDPSLSLSKRMISEYMIFTKIVILAFQK